MLATVNSGSKNDAPQRVQFGNFDIMSDADGRPLSLGKGTFGRTYKARHRFLDTIVALKIINERYAGDPGVRQRFLVEARAVARLSHPHIARLYDFGEVDGVLHYAMEYCGGGSLADQVANNGPLDVDQVIEVGQQIAGALKSAHSAGFIHRDLKPSNIMLTEPNGTIFSKLIDFGLVQPSLPEATKSFSGDQSADGARFLGTPLFASPEQLKEEPLDVRTDLFSLGMTLWYLLLGRAPDSGSSAEIAARRLSPESYLTQLSPDLPSQLRDILARLLQKNRTNRFPQAADALAAFHACAIALGLRRATDYALVTESPDWDGVTPTPPPQQPVKTAPAIAVERVDGNLDSEFKIVTRVNDDFTGSNYVAEPISRPNTQVFLHVLRPPLVEDGPRFELLRLHMAQLKALKIPEMLQSSALRGYADYACIVIDVSDGTDLLSVLRAERLVQLGEAAPLLEKIAAVCDQLTAAGLPGPQLAPAHIFLEWPTIAGQDAPSTPHLSQARPKLYPRFLAVREAPELAKLNEPEDLSSTMTSDMLSDPGRADNVSEHFGTLLYRIVAGRNCPIAASLSSQAYVAVPSLSEQANRLLALVIAKQIERASCGQILREIMAAEGIAPRSAEQSSAGSTAEGTGSTASTATPQHRRPPKTSADSTASSSRFRPMPVAPLRSSPVVPPPLPAEKTVAPVENRVPPKVEQPRPIAPSAPVVKAREAGAPPASKVPEPPPKREELVSKSPTPEAPAAKTAAVEPPAAKAPAVTPPASKVQEPPPRREESVSKSSTPQAPAVTPPASKVQEPPPRLEEPVSKSPTPEVTATKTPAVEPPVAKASAVTPSPAKTLPASKQPIVERPSIKAPPTKPPASKPLTAEPVLAKPAPVTPSTEQRPSDPVPTSTSAKKPAEEPPPTAKSQPRTDNTPAVVPPREIVNPVADDARLHVSRTPETAKRSVAASRRSSSSPEDVVPSLSKYARPIGIGIAALLFVSVSYGVVQKLRSRGTSSASSVAKENPVAKAAQETVAANPSTQVPAETKSAQNENNAVNPIEVAASEQKVADDAKKLAEQKAAEDAKVLAEQNNVSQPDQPDPTKLAPAPESVANPPTKGPEVPKVTQKQAAKTSQTSGSSGGNRVNRTTQSTSRPTSVAPAQKPPPPQPNKNPQRTRSEFGGSAPGG